MTDTTDDLGRARARIVAMVLGAVNVVFIGFVVLAGTSTLFALLVPVVNLLSTVLIVVLLRRAGPSRHHPGSAGTSQVF